MQLVSDRYSVWLAQKIENRSDKQSKDRKLMTVSDSHSCTSTKRAMLEYLWITEYSKILLSKNTACDPP